MKVSGFLLFAKIQELEFHIFSTLTPLNQCFTLRM